MVDKIRINKVKWSNKFEGDNDMEKLDLAIIEQYNQQFDYSERIFSEYEDAIKKHQNGFWSDSPLETTPFQFSRSQLKNGKKLAREPKNTAYKYFHREDDNKNIISVEGYIENYDLPGTYCFAKRKNNIVEYYNFDIMKKIVSIEICYHENDIIIKNIGIQKMGEIIFEKYIYDKENRIKEIIREHKDKERFVDENYFPENIYLSKFNLEYDKGDKIPDKIFWDATPQREMKLIWEDGKVIK
jgi:hypothetical protein